MERQSFGKISRKAILLALPIAATLSSCEEGLAKLDITNASATSTVDVEINKKQEIKKIMRERGLGAVFVNVENYMSDIDLEIMLERVDEKANPKNQWNKQIMKVEKHENVLGATDCDGEYELSFSTDGGRTFQGLLLKNPDKPFSSTFRLDNDCSFTTTIVLVEEPSNIY